MIDESSITWLEPQLTNRLLRIIASYLTSGDESGITLLDGHRSEWDYLRLIASHAAEGNELIEQILPGRSQNNHYRMIASQLTGGSTAGITLLPPRSNFEFIRLIASHYTGGDESSVTLLSGDFSENDFLRFWISSLMAGGGEEPGPSYDPDAAAFFARSGVTDETDRGVIEDFIIGLKAEELWDGLTVCWIGLSEYNAGSGTTVHELKSATNNGTLVNGAGWSSDGLTFGAATQAMTSPFAMTMNQSWTAVAVVKDGVLDISANRRVFGSSTGPTLLFLQSFDKTSTPIGAYDGATAAVPAVTNINVSSFKMITTGYTSDGLASVLRVYSGGTLINGVNNQFVAGAHNIQLSTNSGSNEGMLAGVIAVGMIFASTRISDVKIAALYELLKATICVNQLPNYDPDAIAYFDRVAATTVISDANKSVINNFIVQLKADGLWSIMSACWICRSGYNAGSGTTIFEIKTNTKNGTMTGGPTWTADGTGFSGTYSSSTNYVLTGHTQTMNGSSSAFAVLKDAASDTGGANRIFGGSAAGADPTLLYMDTNKNSVSFGNYDGSTVRAPGASGTNITSFKMIGCVYNPSEPSSDFSKFYTGAAVTQAGGTGGRLTASHTVTLSDNVYGMTAGVGSVFMIFGSNALSAAQVALLYANLKATICADLSLP